MINDGNDNGSASSIQYEAHDDLLQHTSIPVSYGPNDQTHSADNGGGIGIPPTYQFPSSRLLKKRKSDHNNPMHYT